jgi:hypothetical protein
MTYRSGLGTWGRLLGASAAIVVAAGCDGSQPLTPSGTGGTGGNDGGAAGASGGGGTMVTGPFGTNVDILMMIDNSSSMVEMQQKLYAQLPLFIQSLQSLPTPPNLHLAVVSSDMGAPGDSATSIGCTASGDQGEFQSSPRSNPNLSPPVTCTNTTITPVLGAADSNHTFITDADMMPNFTDPSLSDVLQCIALLGDAGCGFEHQLASIDRALGADGLGPVPSTNVGFLRPDAYLVIVMLTNEDDCSAAANTGLYSLNGGMQSIANPLGPIANYRCNQFGHLCTDPASGAMIAPPLNPPADAQGTTTAPTLDLSNCISNDTNGLLTPVAKFVSDIKALKPDPDKQIVVGAISAPATPYTVAWAPASGASADTPAGQLWPLIEHSCGPVSFYDVNPKATQNPTDQSFGDPGVRIAQFVNAFANHVQGSICDASFAVSLGAVASKIGQLIDPQP